MRNCLCLCLFSAVIIAGGCKKRSGLITYPVSGTVMYEGKPVGAASVSFSNANPDSPKAGGFTDSEGRYSLSTYVSPTEVLDGAPPGDYQVAITKQNPAADPQATQEMDASGDRQQEMMQKMWSKQFAKTSGTTQKPTKPKSPIPERYSNPTSSGLKATVRSGSNDSVDFKLTDE